MGQINEREGELNAARDKLIEQEEDLRNMTVTKEKLAHERDYLLKELKVRDKRNQELEVKMADMQRLLQSVTSHNKNPAAQQQLNFEGQPVEHNPDAVMEDSKRADRIAGQMNRSAFMGLGENPPKLYSEQQLSQQANLHFEKDRDYLTDESVPSAIFALIETYRLKAKQQRGTGDLVDEFFTEAHSIMKDAHLREIARIKNENAVEVMRLKKEIQRSNQVSSQAYQHAVDTKSKQKVQASFADNEVERQRRQLIEENERLNRRMRGAEKLLATFTRVSH